MTSGIVEKFLADSRAYFDQQQPEAPKAAPPHELAHPLGSRFPFQNGSPILSMSQWPFDLMRRQDLIAKRRVILDQFVSGRFRPWPPP